MDNRLSQHPLPRQWRNTITRTPLLAALGIVAGAAGVPTASAEFALNFEPVKETSSIVTHSTHGGGTQQITDQTPFLIEAIGFYPELVRDPETDIQYYHMIIGDEASGFIQESFIQTRGPVNGQAGPGSAVGGDNGVVIDPYDTNGGNGRDPLNGDPGIDSAVGEANPRRVLIRQLVSDGEITMEYLKDQYDKKALITQRLDTDTISAEFSLDMRAIGYDDDTVAGTMVNTMAFIGPDSALGSFDMATDVQHSNVTGGRYTYTDGNGVAGSAGSYNYVDGGFDPMNRNWEAYFDTGADNPWSYPENRPQP